MAGHRRRGRGRRRSLAARPAVRRASATASTGQSAQAREHRPAGRSSTVEQHRASAAGHDVGAVELAGIRRRRASAYAAAPRRGRRTRAAARGLRPARASHLARSSQQPGASPEGAQHRAIWRGKCAGNRRGARGSMSFSGPHGWISGDALFRTDGSAAPSQPHHRRPPVVAPPADPQLRPIPRALAGCGGRFLRDSGHTAQGLRDFPAIFHHGLSTEMPVVVHSDRGVVHRVSTGVCGQLTDSADRHQGLDARNPRAGRAPRAPRCGRLDRARGVAVHAQRPDLAGTGHRHGVGRDRRPPPRRAPPAGRVAPAGRRRCSRGPGTPRARRAARPPRRAAGSPSRAARAPAGEPLPRSTAAACSSSSTTRL